jgi:hypothetical protein
MTRLVACLTAALLACGPAAADLTEEECFVLSHEAANLRNHMLLASVRMLEVVATEWESDAESQADLDAALHAAYALEQGNLPLWDAMNAALDQACADKFDE